MACTIVSTPALGASDWSTFITQVAGLKRGFMEVSYTNFAFTAASAIATGGVIEVAGSFYVFSETAIDYSTTTSANADLYIYAQPSAGGTTCSIVALTAACIWVDSRQGFYASAASLNRAIGGMVVGTASTYFSKYIYTPDHVQDCLIRNSSRPLLRKAIQIGEWNMDSTVAVNVPLNSGKSSATLVVYGVQTVILPDDKSSASPIEMCVTSSQGGSSVSGNWILGDDVITLYRLTGSLFDAATYDGTASTVPTRGYVVIEYVA